MRIVRRFLDSWRERRAADGEQDILEWHAAFQVALDGCTKALRDPSLPRAEIGVVLDSVDRALFRVRDTGLGAQKAVRRASPDLAARIRRSTVALVELRNQTARFLIRAQGPTPAYLQKNEDSSSQPEAYRLAMQGTGQAASAAALNLRQEVDRLWVELKPYLTRPSSLPS